MFFFARIFHLWSRNIAAKVIVAGTEKGSIKMKILSSFVNLCLAAFIGITVPGALWAHSFDAALVVSDDADPAIQQDMMHAFLLASEETDGHEGQESDGHLGGMDVYLTLFQSSQSGDLMQAAPDFIVLPKIGDAPAIKVSDAVVVTPNAAAESKTVLASAANPAMAPFAARFRQLTGRQPGPEAQAVYVMARRIDVAIRTTDSVADRAVLRALISK